MSAPANLHYAIAIPYHDDTPANPPVCRVLMSGGRWKVPADERPADWRERARPKPIDEDQARSLVRAHQPRRSPAREPVTITERERRQRERKRAATRRNP